MKKAVFFDFNRTIYNPDSGSLLPETKKVLAKLNLREYSLFLISHGNHSSSLLADLGVKKYFAKVVFTREKSTEDFRKIILDYEVDIKTSFVVGDRIKGEIKIGNGLGLKTIWLKQGLFAQELPTSTVEEPNFTVNELGKVLSIVG